jgi:oligoribonuclease NrnB/cAMP/cGMP phosphodiesterase (DHH superfamily)
MGDEKRVSKVILHWKQNTETGAKSKFVWRLKQMVLDVNLWLIYYPSTKMFQFWIDE